jgi:hypothetical protein
MNQDTPEQRHREPQSDHPNRRVQQMTPADLELGVEQADSGDDAHRSDHSLHSSQLRSFQSAEQSCPAERAGGLIALAYEQRAVFAAFVFAGQLCERLYILADDAFARLIFSVEISHKGRVTRQVEEGEHSGEEVPDYVAQDKTWCPKLTGLVLLE